MPDSQDKFDSIALPCILPQEEQAAFDRAMQDCCIDTCDEDALDVLARNMGMALDAGSTIFEEIKKLTYVPVASGKSREPVVFMLDSLGALEDKKC